MAAPLLAMNLTVIGCYVLGAVASERIESDYETRGGDLLVVDPMSSERDPNGFSVRAAEILNATEGIIAAGAITTVETPRISLSPADVSTSSAELRAQELIVSHGYLEAVGAIARSGRLLVASDFAVGRNVAVVGADLAQEYGFSDHLPSQLFVGGKAVTVVGVLAKNQRTAALNRSVVIPSTALFLQFTEWDGALADSQQYEQVVARTNLPDVRDASVLAALALDSKYNKLLSVDFDNDLHQSYVQALGSLFVVVIGAMSIGAVASALAGLQVQNSSLRLRKPELGTRLALGYATKDVTRMLILESLAVAFLSWSAAAGAFAICLDILSRKQILQTDLTTGLILLASLGAVSTTIGIALPTFASRSLRSAYPADIIADGR